MKTVKKILLWLFAVVGFITALLVTLGILAAYWGYEADYAHLPDRMILSFDVGEGLSGNENHDPLARLFGKSDISLRQAIETIRAAASDPGVQAIVMRVDNVNIGIAKTQELRNAITFFRDSGKKTYAFADTFGFEASGDNAYYLASAFDQVWMQPSGDWGLFGISIEIPFLRGFLDKIGIKPIVKAREEYKNAFSFATNTEFGEAEKQAMQSMADSIHSQRVNDIAENRDIGPDHLATLIDQSPMPAKQALEQHLLDKVGYITDIRAHLKSEYGQKTEFVHIGDYAAFLEPQAQDPIVAVIYADGEIMRGDKDPKDQWRPDGGVYSSDIVRTLFDLSTDKNIKAVVLAINSPGGSYLASDTIWNSVQNLKATGKPVYAVMDNVAASGGYYIAMAADKIYAMPGTLTGSIGVIAGKISLAEAAEKLGIHFDKVQAGNNADLWSPARDFSPEAEKKLDEFLDRSYHDFVQKAANARNMPFDKMRDAARGRVWTGEQALDLGLIDSTGGWEQLEADLRESLKLKDNQEIAFTVYPKPKSAYEELMEKFNSYSSAVEAQMNVLAPISAIFNPSEQQGRIQSRMDWILR
ncbi:MAG: signal peptide peptidase SppA [Alphaproteobacteria bacterium]|nr:MAG: signal peptide peptidase SppA [Alphaproteobacteria bacterium]